ncbi:DDE-type integrase/transposase/recombinase, partial [Thermosyntropha lipolytica]|uniref:DDE-type integrase/transposase/recombinase n=1 Tax=Thermosyntropha lipolytica TaxID=54294 RepID=UPI0031197DB0
MKDKIILIISSDGFPYGYRKINAVLKRQYGIVINHKKTYRLSKELGILKPQRKIYPKRPRRLAKKQEITASNQLWEIDIKYGYLQESKKFFYLVSVIDVFDRMVVDYHLGLNATASDVSRLLKNALAKRNLLLSDNLPVIRTDNGPQFMSAKFAKTCQELKLIHERIPVKT